MPPPPISVFIITKDEERLIGRVIDSAGGIADEIIVVDSGSTDRTREIAEERGAKVIHNDWPGFGPQKRFAEEQCRNDWLLNLDGDEILSPALQDEIKRLFSGGAPPNPAYRMKVTTVYPWDEKPRFLAENKNVVRLYDFRVARYADHPTWDRVVQPVGIKIGQLSAPCYHNTWKDIDRYVDSMNFYSTMQAENNPRKPYWNLALRLLFGLPLDFFKAYILRRHVTGGLFGFVISVLYAYSRFLKSAKALEKHIWERKSRH
jgi:glycosyltransferase involved in cell wall biosynthesis